MKKLILILTLCLFVIGCNTQPPIKNNPPRVLILGDSISIGYTPIVKEMLKDQAFVTRPNANCGNTQRGIENIDRWLADGNWDVIHFNWGLWDLCYRHPTSKNQGNRDKAKGTVTATPEVYAKNLEQLVTKLKAANARLIWASTSFIPAREAGRIQGDDIKYNQVAAAIMKKHKIPTNNIWLLTSKLDKKLFTKPGDVHYTNQGYKIIAQQVAKEIEKSLK